MKGCPICKAAVAPRAENRAYPFCGERCRLIDLGKWLGGEYSVPTPEAPADAQGADHEDEER